MNNRKHTIAEYRNASLPDLLNIRRMEASPLVAGRPTSGLSAVKQRAARLLLCLMLTIAMLFPVAAPADVYAATETTTSAASEEQAAPYSKIQDISCLHIVFKKNILTDQWLDSAPAYLKVKAKRKSIKLSWTGVDDPSKISGYIIVRKDLNSDTWRQIALVKRSKTSYTDKTATSKNKFYRYSLVAYKKVNGKYKVSTAAGWAGRCGAAG